MDRRLLHVVRMKLVALLACAPLALGCADSSSTNSSALTAAPGACGEVETHVFGIYESPTGEATIFIARPGKHAIVLSAHEATHWHVTVGPGVELEHVYAVGYHKQKVDVPDGVDLASDSFDGDGIYACGFTDGSENGCDSKQLLELASKRIHHDVTTFHGCYDASSWSVADDMAATSDCSAAYQQYDWAGGCNPNGGSGDCGSGSGSGSGDGSGSQIF